MTAPKRPRSLRKTSSLAERILWDRLRNRQLHGYKFRRQQRIGPYVADFVCLERRLIVEVDGGQHVLRADDDRRRDAWLAAEGYLVLRILHLNVLNDVEKILQEVWRPFKQATPHPLPPLPQGERGNASSSQEHL